MKVKVNGKWHKVKEKKTVPFGNHQEGEIDLYILDNGQLIDEYQIKGIDKEPTIEELKDQLTTEIKSMNNAQKRVKNLQNEIKKKEL
jgi:hypothetical protein